MYSVTKIDYPEWNGHLQHCRHVNLLQSWQYGTAKELAGSWRAVRFLVRDEQGRAVALAQFLAKALPFLGGAARMNRGPLLIGDVESDQREAVALGIIGALVRECRRRRWWMIQIAPELDDTESAARGLAGLGLRRLPIAAWASGLVSLEADSDRLMAGLNGKWRTCLRKGLRLGVSVAVFDGSGRELTLLLARYRQLQEDRGFAGIPDELIVALAGQTGSEWKFTLFIAREQGSESLDDSIGMLVSIRHGDTSTYVIGSTTEAGRKLQANYVLLWQAIEDAKSIGCRWFDIGGLNSTTPPGVAHFKQGVSALAYGLVGDWRRIRLW